MKENWKEIIEGYQVSDNGEVKSLVKIHPCNKCSKERVLKQHLHNGYKRVMIYREGKGEWKAVHRLVAEAFIPNPNNYPCVNHKDEDKTNNHVSNLEWCTYKYNMNYGTRNKRIADKQSKPIICVETGVRYNSLSEVTKKTGIDFRHLSDCCKGKRKTTGGYHWQYADTQ